MWGKELSCGVYLTAGLTLDNTKNFAKRQQISIFYIFYVGGVVVSLKGENIMHKNLVFDSAFWLVWFSDCRQTEKEPCAPHI